MDMETELINREKNSIRYTDGRKLVMYIANKLEYPTENRIVRYLETMSLQEIMHVINTK